MKPDLERLLKAMDAFRQAASREEDIRLRAFYKAELEKVAEARNLNRDTLDRVIMRYYPRWIRGHLPPDFPRTLGLD